MLEAGGWISCATTWEVGQQHGISLGTLGKLLNELDNQGAAVPDRVFQVTLWVVSGAARRVGKTWLGERLSQVLPGGVYAKVGHGVRKAGKPENFFTSVGDFLVFRDGLTDDKVHCVVESNAQALREEADVRVFVASRAGRCDLRDDAAVMEASADIRISPGAEEGRLAACVGEACGGRADRGSGDRVAGSATGPCGGRTV